LPLLQFIGIGHSLSVSLKPVLKSFSLVEVIAVA